MRRVGAIGISLTIAAVLAGCSNNESPRTDALPEILLDLPERKEIAELIGKADFAAAESRAREVLAEVEANNGSDSVAAAEVLDLLVEALWRSGYRG
jgi:hypothetical protein